MAFSGGRLGGIEGTTTTWKTLYKPAAGVIATVTVNVQNRKNATRTIRIASAQSASSDPTPSDGEVVLYDRTLQVAGDANGKDQLNMGPFVMNGSNNDQIVVYTSGDDVDFVATGVTET